MRLSTILWLIVVAGCSAAPAPPTDLVPVEGQLVLAGKPLAGAAITLVPQDNRGAPAAGKSNASGMFRLSTLTGFPGAKPGDYKVVVIGRLNDDYAPTPQPGDVPTSANVPPIYGQPNTTPLRLTVPVSQPLTLKLQ